MQFTNLAILFAATLSTSATPISSTSDECNSAYKWTISNYVTTIKGFHNIDNKLHIEGPSCSGVPAFKAHCEGNSKDPGLHKCTGAKGLKYSFSELDDLSAQHIKFTYKANGKTFKGNHTIPKNIKASGFTVKPTQKKADN